MKIIVPAAFMCLLVQVPALAALDVRESGGKLEVLRDGEVLIGSVRMDRGGLGEDDVESSFIRLPDGSRVWNRWSKRQDRSFRMEVAMRADGAVEITMQSQVAFDTPHRRRMLELSIPDRVLSGKRYESVFASVRRFKKEDGVFGDGTGVLRSRWLAVDGVTFDFNPLGPGDDEACDGEGWSHMDSMRGIWYVQKSGRGGWTASAGAEPLTPWGGYAGTKVVIREGVFSDYDDIHMLRSFFYGQEFWPTALLSFGAKKAGSRFANGEVPYESSRGYGWETGAAADRSLSSRHPSGTVYSAIRGEKPMTYRVDCRRKGVYILTFTAGNHPGAANRFTLKTEDETVAADVSVPSGKVFSVTMPVRVDKGFARIGLSGKWLVSSLSLQPLLADHEDFSIRRGMWMVDGWEPTCYHRNDTVKDPVVFSPVSEMRYLPEPGTEFSATPRELERKVVLPDADLPSLDWVRNARIARIFNNSSTLAELDAPGAIEKYFDREIAGRGYNVIMLSGMHSRHTYIGQERRGLDAIRRITAEAHRRGMKLIDHFDATLVWNIGEGFRVFTQRHGELIRSRFDGLPTYQFCPSNPQFREELLSRLEKDVANGVDGFQIDEVQYWQHGCVCRHCREKFNRDTGWFIPEDESHPALADKRSPFMKRWHDWRVRESTDFFIELRRRVMDVKPDLVISAYTTPWSFLYPAPRTNYGRSVIDMARTANFMGLEVMTRCVLRSLRSEFAFLRIQNSLTLAYGTPLWDWYYNADWQNDYAAWALSTMTGRSSMLAEVAKDGSVPDYPGFGEKRGGMKRRGAEPVARTALLLSVSSRDWNGDETFYGKDIAGTAQALGAMHVPYEVVGEMSLSPERLSRYGALFVGAAHCLSDSIVETIRDFARKGGKVRLSALAGLFDERGDRRKVWPFRDIFGFDPVQDDSSLRVERRSFGEGSFEWTSAMRGGKFFMMSQTPSDTCKYDVPAEDEAGFRRELLEWCGGSTWWKTDLPDNVFTALWREADGSVAIHFLNGTGVKTVPGVNPPREAPTPAFPPLGFDIRFTVPEGASAVAYSPDFPEARTLESVRNPDGTLTVVLPSSSFRIYTLVRIRPRL